MKCVLIAALALVSGCEGHVTMSSSSTPTPPVDDKHQWEFTPAVGPIQGLGDEWDFVCVSTGRLDDAQVTKRKEEFFYKVWIRGSDYGTYDTLEHAKQKAELTVKARGLTCEENP